MAFVYDLQLSNWKHLGSSLGQLQGSVYHIEIELEQLHSFIVKHQVHPILVPGLVPRTKERERKSKSPCRCSHCAILTFAQRQGHSEAEMEGLQCLMGAVISWTVAHQ
jgi:hypothetical protein